MYKIKPKHLGTKLSFITTKGEPLVVVLDNSLSQNVLKLIFDKHPTIWVEKEANEQKKTKKAKVKKENTEEQLPE